MIGFVEPDLDACEAEVAAGREDGVARQPLAVGRGATRESEAKPGRRFRSLTWFTCVERWSFTA